MADKYDLTNLSIDELPVYTGVPAAGDFNVMFDASANRFVKRDATDEGTFSESVAAGAALTLTVATHAGKTILLDTAAGSTVTLPAATGSGAIFKFVVSALATSNSHIVKVANASDTMQGLLFMRDDTSDNAVAFGAVAGTSDTITLNRSTTGSVLIGEYFEIQDIAANKFQVGGLIANTGTPATPFSATV